MSASSTSLLNPARLLDTGSIQRFEESFSPPQESKLPGVRLPLHFSGIDSVDLDRLRSTVRNPSSSNPAALSTQSKTSSVASQAMQNNKT